MVKLYTVVLASIYSLYLYGVGSLASNIDRLVIYIYLCSDRGLARWIYRACLYRDRVLVDRVDRVLVDRVDRVLVSHI